MNQFFTIASIVVFLIVTAYYVFFKDNRKYNVENTHEQVHFQSAKYAKQRLTESAEARIEAEIRIILGGSPMYSAAREKWVSLSINLT